ncbi:thioredoxin-like-domain-containing protein [Tribonema minus]|uniref:protein-disulfide reductase n=1 Tax=Tribonema minus TaxID=303371 RepID=A0A835YMB1_9STRA|nr:thioredoxin-like-domain-containing protein [Tribonema minus]
MKPPVLLDAGADTLSVHWRAEKGAALYEAQLEDTSSSPGEWTLLSSTLQSTRLRKKNLVPGRTYRFRVRAIDSLGESGRLSEASEAFTTLSEGTNRIQESPQMVRSEAEALTVQWKAVDACEAYELQMALWVEGEALAWTTVAAAVKAPIAKKKGLAARTRYVFRVRHVFSGGDDQQQEWAFSPPSDPLSPADLPARLQQLLPASLVNAKGETIAASSLAGKVAAIYASAHWCGPCRQYTPQLAQLYAAARQATLPVEVVFVSLDRSEPDFSSYLATMPWPAVPYSDPARQAIASALSVNSVPRLMVFSPTGAVLSENAVGVGLPQLKLWCGGNSAQKPAAAAAVAGGSCCRRGGGCC